MTEALLLAVAGFVAGLLNAVAGGGSFVTLPALVAAGLPPLEANATNTVALLLAQAVSALAYRVELRGVAGLPVRTMVGVSPSGGALGRCCCWRRRSGPSRPLCLGCCYSPPACSHGVVHPAAEHDGR